MNTTKPYANESLITAHGLPRLTVMKQSALSVGMQNFCRGSN